MKNKCNIAKDLMPLCIDGVASEESQQYVDEHIAECTECAVAYGEMRVELPRNSADKAKAEMELAAKKMRSKRTRRGIFAALLSVVIFIGGALVWNEIEWHTRFDLSQSVALNMYDAKVYQTDEGKGVIFLNLQSDEDVYASPSKKYIWANDENKKNILEIEMWTTIIPRDMSEDEKNAAKLFRTIVEGEILPNGWYMSGYEYYKGVEPFDEIVVVSGDQRQVIYRRGDQVPLCSVEMNEYLNAYMDTKPEGMTMEEWRAELVKLYDAIPEWR